MSETSAASTATTQAVSSGQGDSSQDTGSSDVNKKQAAPADSDYDEIKIGSVSGKVPRQIAEAIKNLERGFQTKAQEAAAKSKLLSLAESNPKEFYKQTGKDPYEFAERMMLEKFENDSLSPEQKRLRELEAKNNEYESKEMASKQQIINELKKYGDVPEGLEKRPREEILRYLERQQAVHENAKQGLDQEIGDAFKESGLPPDRFIISKVAFEMSSALKRGKNLTAKEALAKVNQEYFGGVKDLFGKMDVKRIHEVVGDEFFERLRKYDLDQVTANAASKLGQNFQNNQGQARASSQEPQKKYLSETEWRKKYS